MPVLPPACSPHSCRPVRSVMQQRGAHQFSRVRIPLCSVASFCSAESFIVRLVVTVLVIEVTVGRVLTSKGRVQGLASGWPLASTHFLWSPWDGLGRVGMFFSACSYTGVHCVLRSFKMQSEL